MRCVLGRRAPLENIEPSESAAVLAVNPVVSVNDAPELHHAFAFQVLLDMFPCPRLRSKRSRGRVPPDHAEPVGACNLDQGCPNNQCGVFGKRECIKNQHVDPNTGAIWWTCDCQ